MWKKSDAAGEWGVLVAEQKVNVRNIGHFEERRPGDGGPCRIEH